jgi:hypothetical protein
MGEHIPITINGETGYRGRAEIQGFNFVSLYM